MAVAFAYKFGESRSLAVTLKRLSDGYLWRQAATAGWQSPGTSSFADRKIVLTEGSGDAARRYEASVSGLGNAGYVLVSVHDEDDSNKVLDVNQVRVLGGNEVTNLDAISGDTTAADNAESFFDGGAYAPTALGAINVTVTPLAVTVSAGEVSGQEMVAYQFCGFSFLLTITDNSGTAINLSGKTISFVVHDLESPTDEVFELTTGSGVTVGGASHNQLTIAANNTKTQTAGTFRWFVKDITAATNAVPLGEGSFTIRETPADA